jgi:cytochrome bd-type quinol oxidase subunit 2
MNKLIFIIFIVAFGYLTFFGIGPLLFADGSSDEKVITAVIIAILYVVLAILFVKFLNKNKHMWKWLFYTVISTVLIIATYFAYGTIFISERPTEERVMTLGIVSFLYVSITFIIVKFRPNLRNNR